MSTMLREGLTPIVFVLNNNGYTIERAIRGEDRSAPTYVTFGALIPSSFRKYNDVANWSFTSLMKALGDIDGTRSKSYAVNTKAELDSLLNDETFASANVMQVVEIGMRMKDAPYALRLGTPLGAKW